MAYASQSGRARTSASNPQAHAICDRCGFRYNWVDLRWQYDWRGATMQNIRILVCKECYDKPQEQLRAIVVPADPTPIVNARVQDFAYAETNYITVSPPINSGGGYVTAAHNSTLVFTTGMYSKFAVGQTLSGGNLIGGTKILSGTGPFIVTDQSASSWDSTAAPVRAVDPVTGLPLQSNEIITIDGKPLTTQPIGMPKGLDPNAVMPLYNTTHYRVPVSVISIVSVDGTTVLTVTTDGAHGLTTNDQLAFYNLTNNGATGLYSVTVTSATQFTYQVSQPIPAGSLTTSTTKVFTVLVGLPYGYDQIPLTGTPGF